MTASTTNPSVSTGHSCTRTQQQEDGGGDGENQSGVQLHHCLIKEPARLLACVQRLYTHNDALMFYNIDRSFKLMLRNDPDNNGEDDVYACDLSIVHDSDDEHITEILALTPDGYFEDDTTFIIDSFQFKHEEMPTSENVISSMEKINDYYAMTICPCSKNFIKDGGSICLFCTLTCSSQDLRTRFCCVCQESSLEMHMLLQPCCSQHIHTRCLQQWYTKSDSNRCPMCRADPM